MANLTDEQIKACFDLFDPDNSGAIDSAELGLVLEGLGFGEMSKDDVDSVLKDVETDANGQLEYGEFKKLCKSRMAQRDSSEEVHMAFMAFDQGNKGMVTVADMMRVASEQKDFDPDQEKQMKGTFFEICEEASGNKIADQSNMEGSGLTVEQWRTIMREAVTDKRHKVIDEAAYSIQTRAKVAKKSPYGMKVEAGKTYFWCSCGHSKNQPYCDGSHVQANQAHGTEFAPVRYEATVSKTVWFCGCKQTKSAPFCDGSHTTV